MGTVISARSRRLSDFPRPSRRQRPAAPSAATSPASAPPPGSHRVRNRWIATAVGGALVVAAITGIGVLADQPPKQPADWDPRVADLVEFVQNERGLLYDHPVPIDFLTEQQYSDRVADRDKLTDEDVAQLEQVEGEMRAFGLVNGDVDLVASMGTLEDEGTLAYYDPETERITVRGTEMTPALRVTLVHELTHVVQDQHFDLQQLDGFESSDLEAGFRALAEGDATRIENRYIDSLDSADRKAYDDTTAAQSDAAGADLSGVPDALVAYFGAPYVLGTDLVDLLEQTGGDKAINQAFDLPPDSEAVLLDPFRFLDGDAATDVPVPALEAGEEKVDDGDMGAIALLLLLEGQLDPHDALDAVDAWDGDAYVGFTRDGRACVRVAIATVDAPGAGRLDQLLTEWSAAVPAADATVSRDDTTVTFESCDPGADATSVKQGLSDTALALPVIRTEIALDVIHDGADPGVARCLSGRIVRGVLRRRPDRGRSGAVPDRRLLPAGLGIRPGVRRRVTREPGG